MTRYFAPSLAMNNFVPADPVFLIRIYFECAPKDFLCLRVAVLSSINFGEIGQNKAVFTMPRDMIRENPFCLVETPFLHQDNAPHARTTGSTRINLIKMLRRANHVRLEAIVKRRDDDVVKFIGPIPSLLQDSGQDIFSPFLLCDEHLAPVLIKDADHVGIRGWIRRRNVCHLNSRRFFLPEEPS